MAASSRFELAEPPREMPTVTRFQSPRSTISRALSSSPIDLPPEVGPFLSWRRSPFVPRFHHGANYQPTKHAGQAGTTCPRISFPNSSKQAPFILSDQRSQLISCAMHGRLRIAGSSDRIGCHDFSIPGIGNQPIQHLCICRSWLSAKLERRSRGLATPLPRMGKRVERGWASRRAVSKVPSRGASPSLSSSFELRP